MIVADPVTQTPRRLGPLAMLVILGAFAVLVALGSWQVQRMIWKEALLSAINDRLDAEPLSVNEIVAMKAAGEDIEYRPVQLTGRFLHDSEQFFFATHNGRSGYYVYTPMALESGRLIFVNRGFVDLDSKDPGTRAAGQVAGSVTLGGLARDRLSEKPSWIVPDNDPGANIFYWKDLDAMAANAGINAKDGAMVDIFVDAGPAPNPGGLPVGGVTRIDLPNNHLQYVITWYGLAAALLGVTGVIWWRGRKPDNLPGSRTSPRP